MSERSSTHDTFVIERTYNAAPARVFAAWADPQLKAKWFATAQEFDFRVGGREIARTPVNGAVYLFEALYQDIVLNERIVYTYIMDRDQTRISVSQATIEFKPAGKGTRLICTEQGVYLDGEDQPKFRFEGTNLLLDKLDKSLQDE